MQKRSFIFRVKQSMKYFGLLVPEEKVIVLFNMSVITHPTARRHSPHDVQLQHWPVWTLFVGAANVLRVRREAFQFPILATNSPQRPDPRLLTSFWMRTVVNAAEMYKYRSFSSTVPRLRRFVPISLTPKRLLGVDSKYRQQHVATCPEAMCEGVNAESFLFVSLK